MRTNVRTSPRPLTRAAYVAHNAPAAPLSREDRRDARGTGTRGVEPETIRADRAPRLSGTRMVRPDVAGDTPAVTLVGSVTLTRAARDVVSMDAAAARAWRTVAQWDAIVTWQDRLHAADDDTRETIREAAVQSLTSAHRTGRPSAYLTPDALYGTRREAARDLAYGGARRRLRDARAVAVSLTADARAHRERMADARDAARAARTAHAVAVLTDAIAYAAHGHLPRALTVTRAARDVVRAWQIGRGPSCGAFSSADAGLSALAAGERHVATAHLTRAREAVLAHGA